MASEDRHDVTVMVAEEKNDGNNEVDPEEELQSKLKRHKFQLQLLVNAIQDKKDKMDYKFERRERTPFIEEGLSEDFEENKENEKEKRKTPPEAKQLSKGSNPESEEMVSLTKKEMRAKVQKMRVEARGISGCSILKGKPYLEWMEREPYPSSFNQLDLPSFDGKEVAR